MDRFEHYGWPFFEERHRQLAAQADAWIQKNLVDSDADATCRPLPEPRRRDSLRPTTSTACARATRVARARGPGCTVS